jgi:hypothetical protein
MSPEKKLMAPEKSDEQYNSVGLTGATVASNKALSPRESMNATRNSIHQES